MNVLPLDPTLADFEDELNGPDTERALYSGYPREGLAFEDELSLSPWAEEPHAGSMA